MKYLLLFISLWAGNLFHGGHIAEYYYQLDGQNLTATIEGKGRPDEGAMPYDPEQTGPHFQALSPDERKRLRDGESFTCGTYLGHPWLVTSDTNKPLQIFYPDPKKLVGIIK